MSAAVKPRGTSVFDTDALGADSWQLPHGVTLFEEMITFMESLRIPDGPLIGQPWKLLDYQVEAVEALCDPVVRRVIISIPRKAGKSAFAAALLLATVIGPLARRNSQVYSAARSRDQASLVYNLAVKIALLTPWMKNEVLFTDSRRMIRGIRTNAEYRALAADATRAHGLSPVFVIHDELGQVSGPTDHLYDAIETAFGAQKSPKSLIISTQAAEDTDLLSTLIDDAMSSGDERTKVIFYAADKNDDPWSEETWKKCHPAYGLFRNPTEFKEAADRAQRLPAAEVAFRRYYLNQRITGDTGFVTPAVWRAAGSPIDTSIFFDGRPVFGGLDLSSKQDLTSFALAAEDDDGNVHLHVTTWTPGRTMLDRASRDRAPYNIWADQGHLNLTPGASIDYNYVAQQIAEITDGMNISSVAYDRWRINDFKRACEDVGLSLNLEPCGQGYRDMSPRIEATMELLLNGKLFHGSNPVLTFAASSATVTRDPAGNSKLDKGRGNGRIDPLQASVMAIGEMRRNYAGSAALPIVVIGDRHAQ